MKAEVTIKPAKDMDIEDIENKDVSTIFEDTNIKGIEKKAFAKI